MGDADGRLGWVGGKIQFQRAESEKSLTHYNVPWRSSEFSSEFAKWMWVKMEDRCGTTDGNV
jgi:hypothetical protein